MVAVLLVALSVGLDNFGAAAAMGASGVDQHLRLRVALVFGVFEAATPLLGLLLGNAVSHHLGSGSKGLAGSVLCVTGLYVLISAVRSSGRERRPTDYRIGHLIVLGAALSLDNLAIGFALGTYRVNILVAALVIGSVSVVLSLIGLEIGSRLGARLGERSELFGGAVMILLGALVATGLL
jgi:manganese efflux pump family protein